MRYADIKRAVLSHIDQYSMTGDVIQPTYNSQGDYLNRIPIFINEALVNIRTTFKPSPIVVPLENGEDGGRFITYSLPSDFWSLRSGGVFKVNGGRFEKTNEYRLSGRGKIIVPSREKGQYFIEYYRYPMQLPLDGSLTDDFEVDEDIDVIQAATYFAAAQLVIREDEFMYATLYNEYDGRLSRLTNGVSAEVHPVEDAYKPHEYLWGDLF